MRGLRRRPGNRPATTPVAETEAAPAPGRFADQLLMCEICGRSFVFTVEEQRRLADAGLPVVSPTECFRHAPPKAENQGSRAELEGERPPMRREVAPPPPVREREEPLRPPQPAMREEPPRPPQLAMREEPPRPPQPAAREERPRPLQPAVREERQRTPQPSKPQAPSVAHTSDGEFGIQYTVRSLGHVKWFDTAKGYGFIEDDDDGQEYFVHQSALEGGVKALHEGQLVEFELAHKARGVEAVLVIVL